MCHYCDHLTVCGLFGQQMCTQKVCLKVMAITSWGLGICVFSKCAGVGSVNKEATTFRMHKNNTEFIRIKCFEKTIVGHIYPSLAIHINSSIINV